MRVFIPAEDGPFDAAAGILVPYRHGLACERALQHAPPVMGEPHRRHAIAAAGDHASSVRAEPDPSRQA
jgi:hypothetical protein